MENTKKIVDVKNPLENDEKLSKYLVQLADLRKDGESKCISLSNENRDVRLNKQIEPEIKRKIIEKNNELINEARKVKAKNQHQVNEIVKEAITYLKSISKKYYNDVKTAEKGVQKNAKLLKDKEFEQERKDHETRLAQIGSLNTQNASKAQLLEHKTKLKAEKIFYNSKKEEVRSKYNETISKSKERIYDAYLQENNYILKIRNGKTSIPEKINYKTKSYVYNFVLKDFFLKNALYFIILVFFIICVIASKGRLLSYQNLLGILGQSSTKMFFSLGVAGLILIGGTDLSIGRMTGLAASIACLLVSDEVYDSNYGPGINLTESAPFVRIIIAIIVAIIACVFFSSIAGFFTAKFKMHPFITTLSTQLLMFGISMVIYSNIASFKMETDIKKSITGFSNINLIIFAAIAILIIWFIWNKTKFGKYMYAVGGNSEAAAVSGISVFKVTMGIFVMAGIMYGLGGFLEGARVGTANPNTGVGTELDAIAACVVGGISFSGGVGKISGAVLGTIIFTGMTYCLTNLGFDANIQFIFKGIIIMVAVCLDSLKYLKRK